MNMQQFRKQYEAIQKQADKQLTALAEQVRQEVIIPYCDKHKLKFVQGNRTYLFYNDVYPDKTPPKHIVDKLEADTFDAYGSLFEYMQDYDGRDSK